MENATSRRMTRAQLREYLSVWQKMQVKLEDAGSAVDIIQLMSAQNFPLI
jgi:hypothetical protein